MDNTAKDFAQKILAQLEKVVKLLTVISPLQGSNHGNCVEEQTTDKDIDRRLVSTKTTPAAANHASTNETNNNKAPGRKVVGDIGVLAAVAVAVINGFQWRDANRNFQSEHRAWLVIKIETPHTIEAGSSLDEEVRVENIGPTVANYILLFGSRMIAPESRPVNDTFQVGLPQGPAYSGAPLFFAMRRRRISPEEIAKIVSGEWVIRWAGHIEYRDIFKKKRTTQYCQIYDFPAKVMRPCGYHEEVY